jgi:2-dehydropantoate 2-reductase
MFYKIKPIQGKDIVKLLNYNKCINRWISFMLIPIAIKKNILIKSNMLKDLKKGRNCEINAINGVAYEYGDKVEFDTPVDNRVVKVTYDIENKKFIPSWKNHALFEDIL